ncbi:PadR family transcriptional regulator [Flavobacteriaceae bacterium AU392]|nr:PadR family transcriptional regulator [Flavobacteriaceae bacterium]RKM82850.1 PadR family transcriptional regulator [Flavobacteriaceae bacterium AU392]
MNQSEAYKTKLLSSWEETYKKGQLTFWLLLSLKNDSLYINEIQDFIKSITKGTISCEDQSIYRSLRKYYDLEIVDYELKEGYKGPNRKYYFLTKIGKELLHTFIQRNISLFYDKEVTDLLNNKPTVL